MINKVDKGRRVETLCKKIFKDAVYFVDSKPRTQWQSPDIFGLFDFIAVKNDTVKLVQVKSNISDYYTARKWIEEWITSNKVLIACEIWLYEGKKKWRITRWLSGVRTGENEEIH